MKSGPLPYTDHEIFLLIVLIHFQSPGKGMAFMPWLVFLFQSSTLCHSILASKYFDYFLIPGNTFVLFHLFGVQIRFFFSWEVLTGLTLLPWAPFSSHVLSEYPAHPLL